MPDGTSGSFSSPKVDFMVDMGNPFLNLAVDGFLKIGAVATAKVAAEETYDILTRQGRYSSSSTLSESTDVEHQPKGEILKVINHPDLVVEPILTVTTSLLF